MKKLLLILLIIPFVSNAQTDKEKFTWEFVNNVKGSKHELYIKARDWAFEIMKYPKAAIQINDSIAGKLTISVDYNTETSRLPGTIYCKLEVDLKDNKYRFISSDYYYSFDRVGVVSDIPSVKYPLSSKNIPFKVALMKKEKQQACWEQIQNDAINNTKDIYEKLVTQMNTQSDNW